MSSTGKLMPLIAGGVCMFPLLIGCLGVAIFVIAMFSISLIGGDSVADDSGSIYTGECEMNLSLVKKNRATMFCEAGAEFKINPVLLVSIFAKENGHIDGSSLGGDIGANYRNLLVKSCKRNYATATGPTQIIDGSWSANNAPWRIPSEQEWYFEIADDEKRSDSCDGGACATSRRRFDYEEQTRCVWGNAVFAQASLIFGKITSNAHNAKTACNIELSGSGDKMVIKSATWNRECVEAVASAYYGAHSDGYPEDVWSNFQAYK